jgi:PIN domain nuclease of toxin-antitoxin system
MRSPFRPCPRHHKDPFDRMLIALAMREGLTLITRDPWFQTYQIPLLKG